MTDFEKVYKKETENDTKYRECESGLFYDPHYVTWLEARLAESTEAMIKEYHNICNNCGNESCPFDGNPIGKCGDYMRLVIEHNTGESIEKILEARK